MDNKKVQKVQELCMENVNTVLCENHNGKDILLHVNIR